MGKIQNQTGKAFEDELMELFTANGYWCKKMNGRGGTVFDVIAIREGESVAFECKTVLNGDKLRYTRELQKKTDELERFDNIAGNLTMAIKFNDTIFFCPWWKARSNFEISGYLQKGECEGHDYFF